MQFGQLAGNDHINRRIYDLLAQLHPEDVQAFVRKFRADSDAQNFHTFRELILGARLRSKGCNTGLLEEHLTGQYSLLMAR